MKILAEISDKSIGLAATDIYSFSYTLRKSGRAILLNDKGEVALQYVRRYGYYKLPGGGSEGVESMEETVLREVKEEVGCASTIVAPVGITIQYMTSDVFASTPLLHIAYCYHLRVVGLVGVPTLEADEIEVGQETVWAKPQEAFELLKKSAPKTYEGKFISAREVAFMEAYLSGVNEGE